MFQTTNQLLFFIDISHVPSTIVYPIILGRIFSSSTDLNIIEHSCPSEVRPLIFSLAGPGLKYHHLGMIPRTNPHSSDMNYLYTRVAIIYHDISISYIIYHNKSILDRMIFWHIIESYLFESSELSQIILSLFHIFVVHEIDLILISSCPPPGHLT